MNQEITSSAKNSNSKMNLLFKHEALQQLLAFASLIILILFFSTASEFFLQFTNILGILLATAVIGVLALGVTFVIITGGIDLSVGTMMTLSSVMTGVFIVFLDLPIALGVLGGILTGAVCGFLNGCTITKMKLPPFVSTLAMMMIARGLSLVITGAIPIHFAAVPGFSDISMGVISQNLHIPNIVFIFFGIAIVAGVVLNKTILGRYAFAMGSNEEATRLSGVNTDFWKISIYIVSGIFAGVAGVLMASRLNSAQPALGAGYELEAIAAVVIGGTSLKGGKGNILGTVIGALIMSVLTNGLRMLAVPHEWQTVVIGIVLIFAVYADMVRRSKR